MAPGIGTARVVLWLLAGVLAIRQIAAVLRLPPGERLTDLETWTRAGGALHVTGSLYGAEAGTSGDHFTGTPFAGLVLKPLAHAAEQALGVGWTFGTLLLVVVLGLVVARALPGPVPRPGLLHPLVTVCAILATANHWVLDAVGGAAVVAAGFGLVYVLAGPRRIQLPELPSPRAATWPGTAMPAGSAGSASGAPK
ncbi:phosphatase PAP2 family protein [Streptomyces sp. HUAS TT7]|uniref:phosphatase PAP2 family protein n=1 Tax=Streptomyces sp. HUAS TT7 TaxID=3447507 RepID=UPI003F660499